MQKGDSKLFSMQKYVLYNILEEQKKSIDEKAKYLVIIIMLAVFSSNCQYSNV